ncbi:hypothetical protein [Prosthecobacter sp.]|uniref:hypothetical protein n=1 Tax=Prosthecobacter sp. TaxID=1965333 RepID=UPI0024896A31|nr:hypothetical protein [Prosthecobacter sp.]MDI1311574.1 hypothetical protein [Prosthecobacter sp.]
MAIGSAYQNGNYVSVLDESGRFLFSEYAGTEPDDGLKGYTISTVSIQRSGYIYTVDVNRRQVGSSQWVGSAKSVNPPKATTTSYIPPVQSPVSAEPTAASTSQSQGGDNSNALAGVIGTLLALWLAIKIFHTPMGWLLQKNYGLSIGDGIEASTNCWMGWMGAALIWGCAAGLLWGFVDMLRRRRIVVLLGIAVGTVLSAWFVWTSLGQIVSHHKNTLANKELVEPTTVPKAIPVLETESETRGSAKPVQTESKRRQPKQSAGKSAFLELESRDGQTISAEILALTQDTVVIRRDDGEKFDLPLSRLSDLSIQKISAWRASRLSKAEK